MMIFNLFIKWPSIIEKMLDIANNKKVLAALIDEQLNELIRDKHPNDYEEFIAKHINELSEIKTKLLDRYTEELRKYLKALKETEQQ